MNELDKTSEMGQIGPEEEQKINKGWKTFSQNLSKMLGEEERKIKNPEQYGLEIMIKKILMLIAEKFQKLLLDIQQGKISKQNIKSQLINIQQEIDKVIGDSIK